MVSYAFSRLNEDETGTIRHYRSIYVSHNVAFGPLVVDSLGRLGDSAFRFFMCLALHISVCDVSSSSASRAYAWAVYHRFRMM